MYLQYKCCLIYLQNICGLIQNKFTYILHISIDKLFLTRIYNNK